MRVLALTVLVASLSLGLGAHARPAPARGGVAATDFGLPLKAQRRVVFDTDEGTWISPALSPDGRSVVFDLLGDLWTVPAEGGRARPVTQGLAFDAQPVFSPDGRWLAFLSDRSGADNLWIMRPDGSEARQITHNEGAHEYVSPAWAPDGRSLYVSLYRSDINGFELWREPLDGSGPTELTKGQFSALGAAPSPDGRYLYYAFHSGSAFEDDVELPLWSIHRMELASSREETVVVNPGSAMRPAISPDGRTLVYTARQDGETALRARDLVSGGDRRLTWPVQHDVQEGVSSRDLTPSTSFTADGTAVVTSFGGKLHRVALADGADRVIPFQAHVDIGIGPFLRQALPQATGPVHARLIQTPVQSPDGKRLAFSAMGRIYIMHLGPDAAAPRPINPDGPPGFMPTWSPDGTRLAWVSWTSRDAGQILLAPTDGSGPGVVVSDTRSYFTTPVFAPDGKSLLALRSSAWQRQHTYQEPDWTGRSYGQLREAELIETPLAGGPTRVLASGMMSGEPQFVRSSDDIFINTDKGLEAIARSGGQRRLVAAVKGPGYYFIAGSVAVDALKISPDGGLILAQQNQQIYLVRTPDPAHAAEPIELGVAGEGRRQITTVGADYFGWSDDGRAIAWGLGDRYFRRPVADIRLTAGLAPVRPIAGQDGVERFQATIEAPRAEAKGVIVLRGATAITMKGDEVVPNADVVIADGRIVSVGPRSAAPLPADAVVRDVTGRFITPGFIDVHDHFGAIRRGVLDFDDWSMAVTLAYGVTTALDPSTLSVDMLAYEDALQTGEVLGPRLYSTAVAIFSYTRFGALQDARDIVSRYVDFYRTRNLKEYRVGSRRQRQWLAMAARERDAMPTTEGALDLKLDLTQILDGYPGNEHTLDAEPLYKDVIQLLVQSQVSYDLTLQTSHGGPPAGEIFTAETRPLENAKIKAFYPDFARVKRFDRAHWVDPVDLYFPKVAAAAGAAQRAGAVIGIGSHGDNPGIGYIWELQAMASGGLTPHEVLKAATLGSAETIGRRADLGSLEPGKVADLLILDADPLADIRNTLSLRQVMKGGRLYDAATLDELWPLARPRPRPWFRDEDAPALPAAKDRP